MIVRILEALLMFVDIFLIIAFVYYNFRVGFLGFDRNIFSIFLTVELIVLGYLFLNRYKKVSFRISFWILSILTPFIIMFSFYNG